MPSRQLKAQITLVLAHGYFKKIACLFDWSIKMSNLREEFEKLPEIAKIIKEHGAFYCDKGEWYLCENIDCSAIELALDTAWYVFQEQQKKIDKISDSFDSFLSECELWGFDSDQADRQLEIIQELLK